MNKYEPQKFIDNLSGTIGQIQKCPFCGSENFTTPQQYASIPVGNDLNCTTLGPSVPAGMVICQKCGYIHFFSLGVLGLLNNSTGGKKNDETDD